MGQGMRYTLTGATVAFVAVAVTIALAEGARLPYEAAYAIGYSVAIITHFSLQRWFVWAHHEGFALSIHHQLARYLPFALFNYGCVAAAIALVPHLLGVTTSAAYLGATVVMTILGFLVLRTRIFHSGRVADEQA